MAFSDFQQAVKRQFDQMVRSSAQLFRVQVEKDLLWDTYLGGFPAGSNPLFRERTEHDCQCCKSFVRAVGGVVSIADGHLVTVWDGAAGMSEDDIPSHYRAVAQAMALLVHAQSIDNLFLSPESGAGTEQNRQLLDGKILTWNHFHVAFPREVVLRGEVIGPKLSDARATRDVLLRSLTEITDDAVSTILDLIAQNSLYRGEENRFAVEEFRKLKAQFMELPGSPARRDRAADLFCWARIASVPQSVSRIRNTAIGTLLVDLSEGKELEEAVKSFEQKVAPANYKRPTALVTKGMIAKAQEKVRELGLESALDRRYAVLEDITINNVLFADRTSRRVMNVFEGLAAKTTEKPQKFDKVEEVGVEKFLTEILPTATALEVLVENRHAGNLVSLIAPVDPDSKPMFKWGNRFSWSYVGDVADSIKERVKRAGGRVDGDLRCSLSWFNFDDLDLHLIEPGGNEIYFGSKYNARTGGQLDVDMNAGSGQTRSAVENIVFPDRRKMPRGDYKLFVHNYSKRETVDVGFEAEVEFDGQILTFVYDKPVKNGERVAVATVGYDPHLGFKVVGALPATQTSKQVWGVSTQVFSKTNVVMFSPNYWDSHGVGNRHYFFMLDQCKNEGQARGFYNEFLLPDLDQHRKVLEMVGSRMKTEESERQLSGLGFSSTKRDSLVVRVGGSFERVVKVIF
jgi:hypothetical protein